MEYLTQTELDEKIKIVKNIDPNKNQTPIQALKYMLCAASAGIIEFLSFTLLFNVLPISNTETIRFIVDMSKLRFVSTIISLTLSVLWNFTFNRKFTFKSASNVPKAMALAFLFYIPFFPFKLWFNGYVPEYIAAAPAAAAGLDITTYLATHIIIIYSCEVISMLINGVTEFCWQKFVIYRKSQNTNELAK